MSADERGFEKTIPNSFCNLANTGVALSMILQRCSDDRIYFHLSEMMAYDYLLGIILGQQNGCHRYNRSLLGYMCLYTLL